MAQRIARKPKEMKNRFRDCPQTLTQCWYDAGYTALYQHCVNVSCLSWDKRWSIWQPGINMHLIYSLFLSITRDKTIHCQQTRDIETIMAYNWPIVCDAGPTLNQNWFNVLPFSFGLARRPVTRRYQNPLNLGMETSEILLRWNKVNGVLCHFWAYIA